MTLREEILTEARTWIGTPWRHQGKLKGVSCDCAGLIMGVGMNTGAIAVDPAAPDYRRFDGYGHMPRPRLMLEALRLWMIPLPHHSHAKAGDVVYRRYNTDPQHLAILTGPLADHSYGVIHAIARPSRAVVEQRTDDTWVSAVHSAWRYPGVTD